MEKARVLEARSRALRRGQDAPGFVVQVNLTRTMMGPTEIAFRKSHFAFEKWFRGDLNHFERGPEVCAQLIKTA